MHNNKGRVSEMKLDFFVYFLRKIAGEMPLRRWKNLPKADWSEKLSFWVICCIDSDVSSSERASE